ncbi:hypothetical protein OY671_007813, partial [Metschnikowia pulcherrima]
ARARRGFDSISTYNWGAMDAVMAHASFGPTMGSAPSVHHEDGFNADEAEKSKPTRNWYRRVASARASASVVPSRQSEGVASQAWHQPAAKVHRIPNGIDTAAYDRKPKRDAREQHRQQRGAEPRGNRGGDAMAGSTGPSSSGEANGDGTRAVMVAMAAKIMGVLLDDRVVGRALLHLHSAICVEIIANVAHRRKARSALRRQEWNRFGSKFERIIFADDARCIAIIFARGHDAEGIAGFKQDDTGHQAAGKGERVVSGEGKRHIL